MKQVVRQRRTGTALFRGWPAVLTEEDRTAPRGGKTFRAEGTASTQASGRKSLGLWWTEKISGQNTVSEERGAAVVGR